MVDLAGVTAGGAGSVDAAVLIGAVLLEAVLLYVGYGAVEQVFGHRVVDRLKGE
ncbi:DUF7512 family protein [Haloarcula salinisoli]|uniref:Uncharacterized protein n=1 Tax=Haloarcula salinisoli TaxID=2487746 RepID=A0A8J7YQ33_9EURY|nr:hypothetical protein [Halomicroarcula salinisoli]MBX0288330.1 hypothetical protein [Halomicroarcula salinisoli]MBX0305811.1 hypothetical protein [Halomicroarcula salinisoli]